MLSSNDPLPLMLRTHRWTLTLTLTLLPFATQAGYFRDVQDTDPYAPAIEALRELGIVEGFEHPGERRVFWPDASVTRAEFVKMTIMALYPQTTIESCLGDESSLTKYGLGMPFWDAPRDVWFAPVLCMAWARHLVSGFSDGSFRPDSAITLAEGAKILAVGFNLPTLNAPDLESLGDEWYRPSILAMSRAHAIPVSVQGFDHRLTRGEVAEMLARLLNVLQENPVAAASLSPGQAANPVTWVPYPRRDLKFSLSYPSSWATPHELPAGTFDRDRLPQLKSTWKIFLGPARTCWGWNACVERDFSLAAFPHSTADMAVQDLEESDTTRLLSDETVNGMRTVLFEEEGDCPLRSAFIITRTEFLRFSLHCGSTLSDPVNVFLQLLGRLTVNDA